MKKYLTFRPAKLPFRGREASSLKDCIHELLDLYRIRSKYSESEIMSCWEKTMGKTISSRTTSIVIRQKKMYVKISSAPLKSQLNMAKTKILQLINKELGEGALEEVNFI